MSTPDGELAAAIIAALQQPATLSALAGALVPAVQAQLTTVRPADGAGDAEPSPPSSSLPSPRPTPRRVRTVVGPGVDQQSQLLIIQLQQTISELQQQLADQRLLLQQLTAGGGGHARRVEVLQKGQTGLSGEATGVRTVVAKKLQPKLGQFGATQAYQTVARKNDQFRATPWVPPQPAAQSYAQATKRRPARYQVQPLPGSQGTPLQPTASSLGEVASTHGYDVLLPARQLQEGERSGRPRIKQEFAEPDKWPLGAGDTAKKHVLTMGRSAEQARNVAAAAFVAQPELRSLGAIILVPPTAAATTPEGALQAAGTTKEAMSVRDLKCSMQVMTKRLSWEAREDPSLQLQPRGHSLMLRWRRADDPEIMEDVAPMPLAPPTKVRMVCALDTGVLATEEAAQKSQNALRNWAERLTWRHSQALFSPCPAAPPLMEVGRRGALAEVSFWTNRETAAAMMRNSGAAVGVFYRPWADKSLPQDAHGIECRIVRIALPENSKLTPQQCWGRMKDQLWFGGLAHSADTRRIAVRKWGEKAPFPPQVLTTIEQLTGASAAPPLVRARVRGYGEDFPEKAAEEARAALGQGVTCVKCTWVRSSGLVRPVYDVELTGLPEGWKGAVTTSQDTRLWDKRWALVQVARTAAAEYRGVGPREKLAQPQKPAEGLEQEPAVEHGMEEDQASGTDEDIL